MSIKHKLATAMATAGLLAGIFGSTLAPVAQGASSTLNTKLMATELHGNVANDWQDYEYGNQAAGGEDSAMGTTLDPWVIYAPESNDGSATASDDNNLNQIGSTYISDGDIQFVGSTDPAGETEDLTASVTATNGLLIKIYNNNSGDCSSNDEYDYTATGSASKDLNDDGFTVCLAVADDDDSFTSTVTVKVNDVSVTTLVVKVVGPGQTLSLSDRTGGWIAMDNSSVIDRAAKVTFLDKSGYNLFTSLMDQVSGEFNSDDAVDHYIGGYWKDGWESVDYDLRYSVDVTAAASLFNDDTAYMSNHFSDDTGGDYRYVDLDNPFCDSSSDSVGDSHVVTAYMDYLGSAADVISSKDTKSAGLTFKCSDDGAVAEITGMSFGAAKSVEAGDSIPLDLTIQDGSGNPMGLGSEYHMDFGDQNYLNCEIYFYDSGDCTAIVPSPIHEDVPYNTYHGDEYMAKLGVDIAFESEDDFNTTCDGMESETQEGYGSDNSDLSDYMTAATTGYDLVGAGIVRLCYTASTLKEDLGVNTVKLPLLYPYTDDAAVLLGNAPKTFKASINVVPVGALGTNAFASTVKVGKRTVSVVGPVGAKVTFVVEDSNMNVKTYVRIVQATGTLAGKAALVFSKSGTYKIYAMSGDQVTDLATIKVKL